MNKQKRSKSVILTKKMLLLMYILDTYYSVSISKY